MSRGGKFLVSTMLLAVAGCGGDMGKLEIRSTPTKLAKGEQPVPQRIAEARGQLALGNVALALEAYRIAAREDPNSTDALLGIAICYDQMGRYDLSRRNYETALAIAPADTNLLAAFAASLQLQGRTDEALSVRQEIAARASAVAQAAATQQASAAPMTIAPAPEVVAPAAAPSAPASATTAQSTQVAEAPQSALPARAWTSQPVSVTASAPEKLAVAAPAVEPVRVEMAAEEAAAPKPAVQTATVGQAVTIKLPPARPVDAPPTTLALNSAPKSVAAARARAQAAASLPPFKPSFRPVPEPAFAEQRGPRLERVSMGEIALVTVSRPVWRAATVARSERSAKIRFVPLRQASMLPVKVRLLNAARVDRLAARTRSWLAVRGWQGIGIGNANSTRVASLILYPADKRWLAYRLSKQFGFAMAPRPSASQVTVLLGSDAARHPALRRSRA